VEKLGCIEGMLVNIGVMWVSTLEKMDCIAGKQENILESWESSLVKLVNNWGLLESSWVK